MEQNKQKEKIRILIFVSYEKMFPYDEKIDWTMKHQPISQYCVSMTSPSARETDFKSHQE